MNYLTLEIKTLLGCDTEWALSVQTEVERECDLSECSARELHKAILEANASLRAGLQAGE